MSTLAITLFLGASLSQIVYVGRAPSQREMKDFCNKFEKIRPNLELQQSAHVTGRVTDMVGAPLMKSHLELRKYISQRNQRTSVSDRRSCGYTEGAWIELKKPILEEMVVLDPRELSKKAEAELCKTYDEVSKLQVQSLPSIDSDPVHQRIDAAIGSAFEIDDDFARLRNMLSREPIVSMRLPNEAKKDSEVAVV